MSLWAGSHVKKRMSGIGDYAEGSFEISRTNFMMLARMADKYFIPHLQRDIRV